MSDYFLLIVCFFCDNIVVNLTTQLSRPQQANNLCFVEVSNSECLSQMGERNDVNVFTCIKCPYVARHFSHMLTHYDSVHSHEPNFLLSCGIDTCQATFKCVRVFKRHIRNKHSAFHQHNLVNRQELQDPHEDEANGGEEVGNAIQENVADNEVNEIDQVDLRRHVALKLLQLREQNKLTYSVCGKVLDVLDSIQHVREDRLSQQLQRVFEEQNVDRAVIGQVETFLSDERQVLDSILNEFSNETRFNKYIKDNLSFVEPREYVVGILPNGKEDTVQYIPILETLKMLLKHEDVFSQVMNPHKSNDGKFRDVCDGSHFQNNQFFSQNPQALQIVLYFDEFTAANPISHKAKNYKFGGFYFLLGNLEPTHRSKLHVIQLALMATSKSIQDHGFGAIMQPLLRDLLTLEEEGIIIEKPEGNFQMKGSVTAVVADNLGAHGIGGFMESFNTLRNCRFCMVVRNVMVASLDVTISPLRTVAGYTEQVQVVTEAPGLANTYGIKQDSPLNQLQHFHVINGLPCDLAHDLFESGLVCDVIEKVVMYCVQQGFFSLNFINAQIQEFPYKGNDKTNKPNTLATQLANLKVKQNGLQVWCLLRLLPLLVGSAVPVGDRKWEVLLVLLDMVECICSPVSSAGDCAFMNDLIVGCLTLYLNEFPGVTLKPKAHFTLHYPDLTVKFGPLIHCWSMRFEAKHNFFKEVVHRVKNRKNLCKTMAYRHQYLQSLWAESSDFLADENSHESRKGEILPVLVLDREIQQLLAPFLGGDDNVFHCESITINGQMYSQDSAVIVGFENDEHQFAKFSSCFIIGGLPYLLCRKCMTLNFWRHYHCYSIQESGGFGLYTIKDLLDYHPLSHYKLEGNNVVVLRHRVLVD